MTNMVKRCDNCGTNNPPDQYLCRKCQVMLPLKPIDLDAPPTEFVPHQSSEPSPISVQTQPVQEDKQEKPEAPPARQTPPASAENITRPMRVIVTGLDIEFFPLIWLLTRIVLASAPALVLAFAIATMFLAFFGGLFGAPGRS